MTTPDGALIESLRNAVGFAHVLVDDDVRSGYEIDWTARFGGRATAVVRPATTAEVTESIRACRQHDVAIVTQGGNTGLVGGGVPHGDRPSVVLSTRRLTLVDKPNVASMQVTAGAGATIAEWQHAARRAGLDSPIDFAARDSATVGGAIATNAGGSRVLRFGTMRQQIMGIEAVLANGAVVGSMSGLPKETAGLHWPSLLAGSEGTLGVVTRARLRLVPWYRRTVTSMVAVGSIADGVRLLSMLRADVGSLDAVELIQPEAMALVAEHLGVAPPVTVADDGSIIIVECAAHDDPTDDLLAVLSDADLIVDSAIAHDGAARRQLLDFRDRLTESIAAASTARGVPTFKLDVAVPVGSLPQLMHVAHRAADDDGCRLIPFGHLAEGNIHLNHLGVNDPDRVADTVLTAVADLGGTISAEHGIGIAKAPFLHLIRSDADLAAQRAIKAALDPTGLFNPGVLAR